MTIRTTLLTSTAALALFAVSATSAQAQLDGYPNGPIHISAGYQEENPGSFGEDDFDFSADSDLVIRFRGVADNGLEYGATINFNQRREETDSEVDDTFAPELFCPKGPTSFEVQAWSNLTARLISNDQAVFATETPIPTLINPAYDIENTLRGYKVGAGLGFCSDIWNLPTLFSLGGDFGHYTGATEATNIPFVEGFGITGVGVTPGVFINSPTDVTTLHYDAIRDTYSTTFQIDQPLLVRGIVAPDGSVSEFSVGFLGGFRAGGFNQEQHLHATTDTPAFGAGSTAIVDYDTLFDGRFIGAFLGTSLTHTKSITPTLSISSRVAMAFGYDAYAIDVDDRVTATGLGGALNYNSANQLQYAVGTPTAGIQVSTGIGNDRFSFSLFGGVDVGRDADINYIRTDSGPAGATPPTLDLGLDPNYSAGTGFNVRW